MNRLLPDTRMLIWIADDSDEMPPLAAEQLSDKNNEVFFSAASLWEVSIKFALRWPGFIVDPSLLRSGLLAIGFHELPIASSHVLAVSKLPHLHGDPFDRLLVAQAALEGLSLVTKDKTLAQYGPHVKRFK